MDYNILVIDDDEMDLKSIQRAFKRVNIINPIFTATDGLNALDILNSGKINKPLLILLDINMPKMNGLEFLRKIREMPEWALTPVVILTSSNLDRDIFEAYQVKVEGYIVKPLKFGDFLETVSTIGSYWSLCKFPPAIN